MSEGAPTLDELVERWVAPGDHVHFASSPFRSNAALVALARVFQGQSPDLVVSATGFHATAHLVARLGLARRLIGSFFGDNYPTPRPNPLYSGARDAGLELEFWSLLSYVEALRAGAMGQDWAVTRSLVGTDLAAALVSAGRMTSATTPDFDEVALIRSMRPDVTFVHALAADERGRVVMAGPTCEGFWGALGAKKAVVVTVEARVPAKLVDTVPHLVVLPPHRVTEVCVSPWGAHPQPLLGSAALGIEGYRDDMDHYRLWRRMCWDGEEWSGFQRDVLDAPDGLAAYRQWVGESRLEALRPSRMAGVRKGQGSQAVIRTSQPPADAIDPVLFAARWIAGRVREEGYTSILAGIGRSFVASRLAADLLRDEGVEVTLMVEVGLCGLAIDDQTDGFLLSYDTIDGAQRHSNVEDVLGALTCGAGNRCLGVLGAAELDSTGTVNSTELPDGRVLVGSGARTTSHRVRPRSSCWCRAVPVEWWSGSTTPRAPATASAAS